MDAIFYREWLPLPKTEFNVLAMIAEQGGSFSGNYSDMCRYLGVTPQDRNRTSLRNAIASLVSKNFISCESRGSLISVAFGMTVRWWVLPLLSQEMKPWETKDSMAVFCVVLLRS